MRGGWLIGGVLALSAPGCGVTFTPQPELDASGIEAPLDVHGVWHGCGTRLELDADGAARFEVGRAGCATTGDFTVRGRTVTVQWEAACDDAPSGAFDAVRWAHGLVLVPDPGRTFEYVDDETPRSLWQLDATDGTGGSSTLAVLGSAETGLVAGCYWSTDLACGGIFSCGGGVSDWTTDATRFHATTNCNGACPCGAVMDGDPSASGGYEATFTGANCDHSFHGTFHARQIAWP
jgi:hypothetical protein